MVGTIDHLASNLADNTGPRHVEGRCGLRHLARQAEAATLRDGGALEFRRMFNNPADRATGHRHQAGAGGTRSLRLGFDAAAPYLKYCERKGFKAEVMEETEGDVAGIRSATIKGRGRIRLRPAALRPACTARCAKSPSIPRAGATPFASLFVYPEIDDSIEIEINPADVRTDTFRASARASTSTRPTRRCA